MGGGWRLPDSAARLGYACRMFGPSITGAHRRRMLTAVAVCLFALRTLVPIGFMVSVGASGAAVTLCSDYAPLPSGALAGHAHHHAHGAATAAAGGASEDLQLSGSEAHGLCPFAAAAHLGWHGSDLTAASGVLPQAQAWVPAATTDVAIARFFLSRSRSPRGPPLPNLD
jgi:hypothetical protein